MECMRVCLTEDLHTDNSHSCLAREASTWIVNLNILRVKFLAYIHNRDCICYTQIKMTNIKVVPHFHSKKDFQPGYF